MKLYYLTLLIFLFPVLAVAQETSEKPVKDLTENLEAGEKPGEKPILLTPMTDPNLLYGFDDGPVDLVQSGLVLGPSGLGVEFTYRPYYGAYYANAYVTGLIRPSRYIPDANNIFTAGVSIGREIVLHETEPLLPHRKATRVRAEAEGLQFYARYGPGIGVTGLARSRTSTVFHPMVHASALVGMLSSANAGGFYIEVGGKAAWYPTLHEMRFTVGPQLTIGFQLFRGRPLRQVQFKD